MGFRERLERLQAAAKVARGAHGVEGSGRGGARWEPGRAGALSGAGKRASAAARAQSQLHGWPHQHWCFPAVLKWPLHHV